LNNKNGIQFTEKNVIGFFAKKTDNWCLRLCETEVIKNNEVINSYSKQEQVITCFAEKPL